MFQFFSLSSSTSFCFPPRLFFVSFFLVSASQLSGWCNLVCSHYRSLYRKHNVKNQVKLRRFSLRPSLPPSGIRELKQMKRAWWLNTLRLLDCVFLSLRRLMIRARGSWYLFLTTLRRTNTLTRASDLSFYTSLPSDVPVAHMKTLYKTKNCRSPSRQTLTLIMKISPYIAWSF